MKRIAAATLSVCALMAGCCNLPTSGAPSGFKRDQVAPLINKLVNNIDWSPHDGGLVCDSTNNKVHVQPAWAEITVTQMEQLTDENNPTIGATLGIFTPSGNVDVKDARSGQTDTVIDIGKLASIGAVTYDPNAADKDQVLLSAHQVSMLLAAAEQGVSMGGLKRPCMLLNTITVTTIVDITKAVGGDLKVGIGPIVTADWKSTLSNESKVTLKIVVHYTGQPSDGGTLLTPMFKTE